MNPSDYICCPRCGKMSETKRFATMTNFFREHICYNDPDICTREKPLVCRICPYPQTPFCRPFFGKDTMYACRGCIKKHYGLVPSVYAIDQDAEEAKERPSQSALEALGPPYNGAAPPTLPQGQSGSLVQVPGPSLMPSGSQKISSIGIAFSQPSTSANPSFGQTNAPIVSLMLPHTDHAPWLSLPQVNSILQFWRIFDLNCIGKY